MQRGKSDHNDEPSVYEVTLTGEEIVAAFQILAVLDPMDVMGMDDWVGRGVIYKAKAIAEYGKSHPNALIRFIGTK